MSARYGDRMMPMRESDFLRDVLALARLYGWRTAHFRPALTQRGRWITAVAGDGKGFPDLLLVRGKRLIAAELKSGRNRPTPEQRDWLNALASAGVATYVWRPDDWREIEGVLQ